MDPIFVCQSIYTICSNIKTASENEEELAVLSSMASQIETELKRSHAAKSELNAEILKSLETSLVAAQHIAVGARGLKSSSASARLKAVFNAKLIRLQIIAIVERVKGQMVQLHLCFDVTSLDLLIHVQEEVHEMHAHMRWLREQFEASFSANPPSAPPSGNFAASFSAIPMAAIPLAIPSVANPSAIPSGGNPLAILSAAIFGHPVGGYPIGEAIDSTREDFNNYPRPHDLGSPCKCSDTLKILPDQRITAEQLNTEEHLKDLKIVDGHQSAICFEVSSPLHSPNWLWGEIHNGRGDPINFSS